MLKLKWNLVTKQGYEDLKNVYFPIHAFSAANEPIAAEIFLTNQSLQKQTMGTSRQEQKQEK